MVEFLKDISMFLRRLVIATGELSGPLLPFYLYASIDPIVGVVVR